MECNYDNKYDLVIGPVADDDLALLFRQFSGGLISVEVLVEAMREFYASETYLKLVDEETGLYYESAAYVYDIYKDEKRAGHLVEKCE